MKIMVREHHETSDYGYFIDIDNVTSMPIKEVINNNENENVIKENSVNKQGLFVKPNLFCFNTFCCVAVSVLFVKIWLLSPKN